MDSLIKRNSLFASCAILATHSNMPSQYGFRQKDIKFYIELFYNWSLSILERDSFNLNNNQVARYTSSLLEEGLASKTTKKGIPHYKLSRIGILEIAGRISSLASSSAIDHILFQVFFLRSYKDKVFSMVEKEGKHFPLGFKIELEEIFDTPCIINKHIANLKKELHRIDERIIDAQEGSLYAQKLIDQNLSFDSIVRQVEKNHPYELNALKPLSELIKDVPKDLAIWELTIGSKQRAKNLWSPIKSIIEFKISLLDDL
jgi:hypothetical protein